MIDIRKCLFTLLGFGVLVVALGCVPAGAMEEKPYKMLQKLSWPVGDLQRLNYSVSIPEAIDVNELKQLVCRILDDEGNPAGLDGVNISIFVGLDSFTSSPVSSPEMDAEVIERSLAAYTWQLRLEDRLNLYLFRDADWKRLKGGKPYEFTHVTDCPGYAEKAKGQKGDQALVGLNRPQAGGIVETLTGNQERAEPDGDRSSVFDKLSPLEPYAHAFAFLSPSDCSDDDAREVQASVGR